MNFLTPPRARQQFHQMNLLAPPRAQKQFHDVKEDLDDEQIQDARRVGPIVDRVAILGPEILF